LNSSLEAISVQLDKGVGWITLNRPRVINAINGAMRTEIPAVLRELDKDPHIRVIGLRGAGPKGFCAGADISESGTQPSNTPASDASSRSTWIQSLDGVTKPLVAVIHGYCFGGGLEIALACDVRIAAADAQFAFPETSLGLIPGGGGTQRLPRVIGLGRALSMLLTGDRVNAVEAQRAGLITEILPAGEAHLNAGTEFVERMAQRPPMATRFAKQAARMALEQSLPEGLRLERELFVQLLDTEDHREASAAFRGKRPPNFRTK
jgi:enoyl-CoA hydratase/carnithine racemase